MTSPLLALFIRSLREDSRLRFTYLARAGFVAVILFFLFATQSSMGWANAPGLRFFSTVVMVDLCFVLLAGVSYFSSAVSEEKEEMTLGLLRMTNLNPLSILLGKSTSRLCTALLLFAAQIPFTLLAITLGGISLRQIFACYLAIGAFLIFVGNLALLASVLCRRTSSAAVLTGVTLLVFFTVVPIANWFAQMPIWVGLLKEPNAWTLVLNGLAEYAEAASPFSSVSQNFRTGYLESAFTWQVWSNLAMGLLCFLLAWVVFEKFCGEQKESGPGRVGVAKASGRWRALSPRRAWGHALAWKDFYFTAGGKLWVLIKLAVYGTPLFVVRLWPQSLGGPPKWEEFGVGTFWFMVVFIGVELAFAAATIFRNERQGQTLSSLAMLPQGLRRVAYEKLLGTVPALFAAGFYLVLTLPLVAKPFLETLRDNNWHSEYPGVLTITTFIGVQALFFLHLATFLSLYVKRGALPLAIGIHFLLFVFAGVTGSMLFGNGGSEMAFMNITTIVVLGVTCVLHTHIGDRLETLAAEE